MPLPSRLERINALLQERINDVLLTEVEMPLGTLVTITKLRTTPDLKSAKVYISVLPEQHRGTALALLRKAIGPIKRSLYQTVSFHTIPSFEFVLDETEAYAAKVEDLIDSLELPND